MRTTLDKQDLIAILKANRKAHRGIFEEAVEGYRKKAIEILNEHMDSIKSGKLLPVYWNLPRPEDHTKDYDRIISMVRDSLTDTIELTEQDYASYVQDDWQWKRQFLASNSFYSASAKEMLGEEDGA